MGFKGILIPIGGNEDKAPGAGEGYSLDYVTEGILSRVVRESGGAEARIVVIPTASSIPDQVAKGYLDAFSHFEIRSIDILDIRHRDDAENLKFINLIMRANCIMFSGGDQSKIVDIIGGSTIHRILKHRFQNERIIIAGTSAGAMAMASEMIAGGSSSEALYKGSVKMREGMEFIPGLIIDSHFIKRGRFGRLAEAVARYPHLIGFGLAEDTGLIITNCNHVKVIGSGMVIIFDPASLTHNNIQILEEGTPLTMSNLTTHVLANGDSFHLDERKIEVLPIDADFE